GTGAPRSSAATSQNDRVGAAFRDEETYGAKTNQNPPHRTNQCRARFQNQRPSHKRRPDWRLADSSNRGVGLLRIPVRFLCSGYRLARVGLADSGLAGGYACIEQEDTAGG